MSDYVQFPPPPPPSGDSLPRAPWSRSPQAPAPTRLYRSRNHRIVGGVAGGIARQLGVDLLLIRFATVLVLMSGLGIFAYLAAWVLIPLEPRSAADVARANQQAAAERAQERRLFANLNSALVIGLIAVILGIVFESFTIIAMALIGGGIWLLSQQPEPLLANAQRAFGDVLSDTPQAHKVPLSEQDRSEWRRQYEWEAERYGWPDLGDAPTDVLVQAPPRQRQFITRLVLSGLLFLLALGTAANAGGWWDVRLTRMLGIALVIVGTGVVLGAVFRNRARGLIPLGIVLAVALIPASVVSNTDGGFSGFIDSAGERTETPATLDDLNSSYDWSVGQLTLDLSKIDFDGATRAVDISMKAGEILVLLPPDVGGFVSARASAGDINISVAGSSNTPQMFEGIDVRTGEIPLAGANGQLLLTIKTSVGEIDVKQADQ